MDLKRHSEGYWRSIFIFGEFPQKQSKIRDIVCKELDQKGFVYSYCFYSEVKAPIPKLCEKAHITFRINFPAMLDIDNFEAFLRGKKYSWESHNYDEEITTKMAYVMGTKLASELLRMRKEYPVPLNENFYRIMFHGLFNDLHKDYKDEAKLYFFLFKCMIKYAFGFDV